MSRRRAGVRAALSLAALLLASVLAPAAAQDGTAGGSGCTCLGLGRVALVPTGSGYGSGPAPLAYAPAGTPRISAQISFDCGLPDAAGTTACSAEVQAVTSGSGTDSAGTGSGSRQAAAPLCLVLGEALVAAWNSVAGPQAAERAPGPCS